MAIFSQMYPDIVPNLRKLNQDLKFHNLLSTFQNLMAWFRVDWLFHMINCGMFDLTNWRQFIIRQSCYWSWFRNKTVKEAVDSRVDPQTTLTMFWRNSLSITGQKYEKMMLICFFTIKKNCKISRSRALTHGIDYKLMCLPAYWQ